MTKKRQTSIESDDKVVKNIRRKARKTYSVEEMIRLVLAGLLGKQSTSVMCRRKALPTAYITAGLCNLDLSRFSAAPSSHLCGYLFKSQWAFPT